MSKRNNEFDDSDELDELIEENHALKSLNYWLNLESSNLKSNIIQKSNTITDLQNKINMNQQQLSNTTALQDLQEKIDKLENDTKDLKNDKINLHFHNLFFILI